MTTQIQVLDISLAYFCADTHPSHPMYVNLPAAHPVKAATLGRQMGALLLKHMYGTRNAADGWHLEYAAVPMPLGFEIGAASACVSRHKERRIRSSACGGDFSNVENDFRLKQSLRSITS